MTRSHSNPETPSTETETDSIFGPVIFAYTRSQAIEDGVLVDLTAAFPELVKQAGFKIPVAMTSTAFAQYVELTPAATQACNDITGRAWDVLWMLSQQVRGARDSSELLFVFYCVTDSIEPSRCELKAVCGPDDDCAPCITIMLPEED